MRTRKLRDHVLAERGFAAHVSTTPRRMYLVEDAEADILAHGQGQEQSFGMAVVGNEADARMAHRRRMVARDAAPGDRDRAGRAPLEPGDGAQELALAFALDAGQPDDLAGAHVQIDLGEDGAAQAAHLKDHRADRRRFRREDLPGVARRSGL